MFDVSIIESHLTSKGRKIYPKDITVFDVRNEYKYVGPSWNKIMTCSTLKHAISTCSNDIRFTQYGTFHKIVYSMLPRNMMSFSS